MKLTMAIFTLISCVCPFGFQTDILSDQWDIHLYNTIDAINPGLKPRMPVWLPNRYSI